MFDFFCLHLWTRLFPVPPVLDTHEIFRLLAYLLPLHVPGLPLWLPLPVLFTRIVCNLAYPSFLITNCSSHLPVTSVFLLASGSNYKLRQAVVQVEHKARNLFSLYVLKGKTFHKTDRQIGEASSVTQMFYHTIVVNREIRKKQERRPAALTQVTSPE